MMYRLLFTFIALCASGLTWAQSCINDTDGVSRTSHYGTPSHIPCPDCRSVQDFPQDSVNAVANFFLQTDQGAAIRDLFLENTAHSGVRSMDVPVCNGHGQCGTGNFQVNFNRVGVRFEWFEFSVPTTVRDYTISFRDVGGDTTVRTYPTNLGELDIPADNTADTIPDGECRNSNGTPVNPPDDVNVADSTTDSGGGYDDYFDDYEDYWEGWANGYGDGSSCRGDFSDPSGSGVICGRT